MDIDPRHELELAVKKLESDPSRWCQVEWGNSALNEEVRAFTYKGWRYIYVGPFDKVLASVVADPGASGPSRASGMLAAHYEPHCTVVPVENGDEAADRIARLRGDGRRVEVLDRTADVVVAAQRLYADLRDADDRGVEVLVVVMPAATGIGLAVRDRLTKAAAGAARRDSSRGG
jgi:hypothetical protein